MKNILFSTTRQWNPGDEFILMGCINILKNFYPEFNPIIYNRNPEVRQELQFKNSFRKMVRFPFFEGSNYIEALLASFLRFSFFDNSFKDNTDGSFIDLAIFAGSPEWCTKRCLQMYKTIEENDIPVIYLGIGSACKYNLETLPDIIKNVLRKAKLITVRDSLTLDTLKDYNAQYLPCPALLSVPESREKQIKSVKKLGLVYGTYKTVLANDLSQNTYNYIVELYKSIIEKYGNDYEIEIICHYIDELEQVTKDFPNIKMNYSYNSADYIDIFSKFDLIIAPRVHAIGMAASLGIPGICISHDSRGETCKGFNAKLLNIGTPFEDFDKMFNTIINNIEQTSIDLINHKHNIMEKYCEKLRMKLD